MHPELLQLAFLGPGGGEMFVVMLVLLMLFGSKDAPRIFRKLNEMMGHVRRTAEQFKHEVMYGDLKTSPEKDEEHDEPDLTLIEEPAAEDAGQDDSGEDDVERA